MCCAARCSSQVRSGRSEAETIAAAAAASAGVADAHGSLASAPPGSLAAARHAPRASLSSAPPFCVVCPAVLTRTGYLSVTMFSDEIFLTQIILS